jgi:hypothetical protein
LCLPRISWVKIVCVFVGITGCGTVYSIGFVIVVSILL